MACKVSPIKDKEGNNSHSFFLPFLQKMLPRATRIKLKQKNKNDAFQHFDHHHLLVFMNDDDTLGIYQRLTKLWKTSIYEMSG